MADYANYAEDNNLKMKQMPIKVQLTIFNTGSHFSEDKKNQCYLYMIVLVVFIALAAVNYQRYVEDQARIEEQDSPLYFTFGSLTMTVTHCVLKCVHYFYYSQDGVGSMLCEMFAHVMMVFSRITMITILIAFGFGWQVIYENTMNVKKKIQWIYIFVLLMAAYDDYALSKWISEHPSDLFHLMQSSVQWTFYLTKGVEYAIFCFALWRSKRVNNKKLQESLDKIGEEQGTEVKALEFQASMSNNIFRIRDQFFNQLWIMGTLFFASTPLAQVLSSKYLSPASQQMF